MGKWKMGGLIPLAVVVAILLALVLLPETRAAEPAASAPTAVAPLPPCWPSTWGGSGTELETFSNKNGQVFGWWCNDPSTGTAKLQRFHAARGYVIKWPKTLSGTPAQVAESLWKANVDGAPSSSPEIFALYAALAQNMASTKPDPAPVTPPPPPPQMFRVMKIQSVGVEGPNAKVSTLKNGALTAVPPETKTAPWGVICDCSAGKFIAADQAFCPFGGQTEYVARCQLQ